MPMARAWTRQRPVHQARSCACHRRVPRTSPGVFPERPCAHSTCLANVSGCLKERPQSLLEVLITAEAVGELVVDEDCSLGASPQRPAVRLNRALEPGGAQLGDFELTVLDVRHRGDPLSP